jgi:HSP20 family molecular chaperone IbpA
LLARQPAKKEAPMLMRSSPTEFDQPCGHGSAQGGLAAMPMDAYRDGDQLIVNFDLPGVDPSELVLTVERKVLTVGDSGHKQTIASAGPPWTTP